ncbi:MAG: RsfS/YbeB/iojap family protein [Treponema sp.]|nr:RsfS/YbeB/iojap family protein [Treponema sp.]
MDGDRTAALARALGVLLEEHKGSGVVAIDLRQMNTWTDFFVIATVTSNAHLDGLDRHIKDFVREHSMEIIRRSPRLQRSQMQRLQMASGSAALPDDEWRIIDMGTIVVHLMSGRARSFYELERLYPPPLAEIIYPLSN